MQMSPTRYHSIAIILHWVMALAFLLMLGSGLVMSNLTLPQSLQFNMYQWHKSLGVLLLLAFFIRIAMRLVFRAPKLPPMPKLEAAAAKFGHLGLYALMLIIPLSGWVMVSSSVYGLPTIVFDLFEWPHIPGLAFNEGVNKLSKQAHELLAYGLILMIIGHVAAVIKHAVVDKHNLLKRMWFGK